MKADQNQQSSTAGNTARPATGAVRSVPAEDLDPGRERRPLESYFQEIGGTRTLRREEEVILAKELESATADLRDALYQIPCSARHVVERWDALRALSHTGAKLSESIGSEETGEIAARVARAVKRIRTLRAQRLKALEKTAAKELERIDAKIVRELKSAHLSLGAARASSRPSRPTPRSARPGCWSSPTTSRTRTTGSPARRTASSSTT